MISTIGRLVQVAPTRWVQCLSLYVMTGLISSMAFGAILGALGALSSGWIAAPYRLGLLTVAASVYGAVEILGRRLWIPSAHGSVPQWWWERFGPLRASMLYGGVLSVGISTVVRYPSYWIVVGCAFLFADLVYGSLLLLCYGSARAASLVFGSIALAMGASGRMLADGLINAAPRFHRMLGLSLLGFAVIALRAITRG